MKFRNHSGYRGEYFVALTIPATEDALMVPCESRVNADWSYRFVFNTLYAAGDLIYAGQHAARILAEHPTWEAGLYRVADNGNRESVFMSKIGRAA